ncbi:pentatricopeptide repeat-containing protein At4g21300 [Diospyros lotus]|uniref:pentatricopeptide repeat-containing protein At4g21300 n=1 Tax=Diospyros lotus TaxID=55363 RepID=UPI002256267E|nr:pentatricopeptide repeat-containing protein At4g21300 [Diospyros lotus]
MHHKHLSPALRNHSHFAFLGSKSIHTNTPNPIKPFGFFPNTQETLAAKLASILQVCTGHSVLKQGQQVHAQITVNGLGNKDCPLGSRVLGVYVICGSFRDAKNLFSQLDLLRASPWNWMIRGLTIVGWFRFALLFYFKMLSFGSFPDKYTFPFVIKACGALNAVQLGKYIRETIRLMGFETDVFVGSALIKFYAENGCIHDARFLFDKMPQRDGVLWNVMLNGCVKSGDSDRVIGLFREMRATEIRPNSVTCACVLSVCASEGMVKVGAQLHGLVVRCGHDTDSPVTNTLITMYAKCRWLSDARALFDATPQTETVSWNGLIGGYVQNGFMFEATDLFREMICAGVKPDSITFTSILPSISESTNLNLGKEAHGYIVRHGVPLDVFLKSALIDVYFKCRDVHLAQNLFNHNTAIDIVICTAMISGYVLNGMNAEALEVFQWLLHVGMRPNAVTLASILPACAGFAALRLGKELHGYILKNGLEERCYVGSAVLDMYAKCGRLDQACRVFPRMPEKDSVCWNSMITSCSQGGKPDEAIQLFRQMGMEGAKYDCVSISAALSACANLPALNYGKEIHGFMVKGELTVDLFAQSALIDMYAKCGNLDLARRVFDTMRGKNEVSWNSIIAAYGNHGRLNVSLELFHAMLEEGFRPDHVTFLAIISACGHAGQVDEGKFYFQCMTQEHGIPARMEHYACMVDLFARAGRLKEAFEITRSMPFGPDAGVWGTLLGACRVHGNVELAELASKHLFELDPQNSGYYVILSNLQAEAGKWEGVLKTRSMMKERRVQKVPGCSWIELNNGIHMFVAADTSHQQSAEIFLLLRNLLLELRREGYVAKISMPMHLQNHQALSTTNGDCF